MTNTIMHFEEKARITCHVELTVRVLAILLIVGAIIDQDWLGYPLAVFIILALINAVSAFLAVLCLYKGVQEKEIKKLKIWLIFNLVVWILDIIGELGMIFNIGSFSIGIAFLTLAGLVYRGISMWIIWKFFQELKTRSGHGHSNQTSHA